MPIQGVLDDIMAKMSYTEVVIPSQQQISIEKARFEKARLEDENLFGMTYEDNPYQPPIPMETPHQQGGTSTSGFVAYEYGHAASNIPRSE